MTIPIWPLTWDSLVAMEPRLQTLLDEAKSVRPDGATFCANAIWYGYGGHQGFKPRLSKLVGWERCPPCSTTVAPLASEKAYDIAYETIYEALPDCRDCGCMRM